MRPNFPSTHPVRVTDHNFHCNKRAVHHQSQTPPSPQSNDTDKGTHPALQSIRVQPQLISLLLHSLQLQFLLLYLLLKQRLEQWALLFTLLLKLSCFRYKDHHCCSDKKKIGFWNLETSTLRGILRLCSASAPL